MLDLQAVTSSKDESKNFKESLLRGADGKEFLPVSVIYGPNAGGKSNVLKALSYAVNIVTNPITLLREINRMVPMLDCEPFRFDDTSRDIPTEFTFFFRPDKQYEYKYFIALQNNKIVEEYMYRKKIKHGSHVATVFDRTQDSIKLGSCFGKVKINLQINNSIPLLSFLAINYEIEPISIVVEWLQQITICDFFYKPLMIAMLEFFYEDKQIVRLMNDVGIDISDYQIQRDSADTSEWNVSVEHTVDNKKYQLNLVDESEGTQKLFELFPWV
ncbi:MAG: ATP-binding protein, partial [Ruminococcaceae bacterium]|nr:ATP-binding protein [Oscillospiraceae bacterium]